MGEVPCSRGIAILAEPWEHGRIVDKEGGGHCLCCHIHRGRPPHPERSGHSVKIKLDENLPLRLVPILSRLGHETDTIPQEGFAGQDDADVWEAV